MDTDLARTLSRIEDVLDEHGGLLRDVRERVARMEGERSGGLRSWQVFAGAMGIMVSLGLGLAGLLAR